MRVLVFSDSHGYVQNMEKALSLQKKPDMVIHLGDYARDAVQAMQGYHDVSLEAVRGNNDWGGDFPSEKLLELNGKRVLITHGHGYRVKYDLSQLVRKGTELNADAVLFGHTHTPEETRQDGILLLNPGSIGDPRLDHGYTFCSMDISESGINVRFQRLGR